SVATAQPPADPQQEIEFLKKERDGHYDRLLRKQAEFENYRKRMDCDKYDFMQFASADLMKELLNVLDSFELALKNAATQNNEQNVLRGFELIYKQIEDTLARFGLKPIEAKGKKFDPHFHQAVSTEATDEVEENTVIQETRKLRPLWTRRCGNSGRGRLQRLRSKCLCRFQRHPGRPIRFRRSVRKRTAFSQPCPTGRRSTI